MWYEINKIGKTKLSSHQFPPHQKDGGKLQIFSLSVNSHPLAEKHATGGMPLAFTQEDFLVLNNSFTWLIR